MVQPATPSKNPTGTQEVINKYSPEADGVAQPTPHRDRHRDVGEYVDTYFVLDKPLCEYWDRESVQHSFVARPSLHGNCRVRLHGAHLDGRVHQKDQII